MRHAPRGHFWILRSRKCYFQYFEIISSEILRGQPSLSLGTIHHGLATHNKLEQVVRAKAQLIINETGS